MTQKTTVFFPNLDGLRFVAFFLVFLAHCFFTSDPVLSSETVYQAVIFVSSKGIFGVNFFFVLSGFLITYLLLVEKRENGKVNVIYFYFRRFLRIWPLYYAVVVFGFLVLPFAYSYFGEDFGGSGNLFLYLFFLSNFDKTTETAILGILWSIAVEEQFYLVWPLIFLFVRTRHHYLIFYGIIIGSLVFRLVYIDDSYAIFKHTFSCISDMAVGGLGAYWAFNGMLIDRIRVMPKRLIFGIYVFGTALIILRPYWNQLFYGIYALERLIYSIYFLFVVLEQNYAENSFYKMENFRLISKLGIYTYGLYMVHFISIYFFNFVFDRIGWNSSLYQLMIVEPVFSLCGAIALALISFYLLENPFLKLKRRFSYIVKN